MSVLFAPRESRAVAAWPDDSIINPPGNNAVPSYANVNLSTTEASLQKIAIAAATNLIASILRMLPVDGYSGDGVDKRPITLPPFFGNPDGSGHGLPDWLYMAAMSVLLRGNVVGIIPADALNSRGKPTQILLQHPDIVSARMDTNGSIVWRVAGKLVDPLTVWHKRMYPMPGQILGMSPITRHALSIGVGLSALKFGAQWFTDGAHPNGVLSSDDDLNAEKATTAKKRFMSAMRGRREPVVLGRGFKWQAIQVTPDESQFLGTQKYSDAECARIYGPGMPEILGYETGSALTYQNRVERNQDLLTFSLDPWLTFMEEALSALLPKPQYVKFNRDALLRMSPEGRWQVYQIQLRNQATTVNRVMELEDSPPLPWGDEKPLPSNSGVTVKSID